jgi:hypothetical protein
MEVFHWMCGVSSTKTIKILKRLGLLTGARWHDSLVLLFLTDAVLVYGSLPRLTNRMPSVLVGDVRTDILR